MRQIFHVFSYRIIPLWERKLIVDDAFQQGIHHFAKRTDIILNVDRITSDTIYMSTPVQAQNVKNWWVYQYNDENSMEIFPKEYNYMKIKDSEPHEIYIPSMLRPHDIFLLDTSKDAMA
jgi:hypothetical protein